MIKRRVLLGSVPLLCGWSHGVLSSALIASATKIVNAANNYVAPTILGSPPSLTVGAAFGASMISGISNLADNPTVVITDARLALTGPIAQIVPGVEAQGWTGAWTSLSSSSLVAGGDGWGCRFQTNSRFIELSSVFDSLGSNALARLMVNNAWAQASDYTLFSSADFSPHYALWDLGVGAPNTIGIFVGGGAAPVGINLTVGATLTLPSATPLQPTAAFWGDSYIAGNFPGELNIRNTMAEAFGQIMGVVDIVPEGVGGQGYVTTVNSLTIMSRMLSDPSRISQPDIVYAMGSLNDRSQTAATVQANISTGLSSLQNKFIGSWIVFFTGFTGVSAPVDGAHFTAALAGASAVADSRTIIIDTSGYPAMNTTGTLPNSQPHDSVDGVHPGPNEMAYLTSTMKPAIVAAIKARAGI